MCPMYNRGRLDHIASTYGGIGGVNNAEINFEDHFLSIARSARRVFNYYKSLSVPDSLRRPPKVERIRDLIRVKQPGSLAVSVQIQAILSYSPAMTEELEKYPKYGERLQKLAEFVERQPVPHVC
jgi:hypothetical protein